MWVPRGCCILGNRRSVESSERVNPLAQTITCISRLSVRIRTGSGSGCTHVRQGLDKFGSCLVRFSGAQLLGPGGPKKPDFTVEGHYPNFWPGRSKGRSNLFPGILKQDKRLSTFNAETLVWCKSGSLVNVAPSMTYVT